MSRESKRHQAKQERRSRQQPSAAAGDGPDLSRDRERTPPGLFLREVRSELKKVAWPSRKEVTSYTIVVLITTTVLTLLVFGMDFVLRETVIRLFG